MTTAGNGDLTYPPCVVCKKPVIFSIPHVTWQARRGSETGPETFEVVEADVVAIMHHECSYAPLALLKELVEVIWRRAS